MDTDPEYMALLGGVRTTEQTDAYLELNLKHWDDYGYGLWILRDQEHDRIVGRAVLRHLLLDDHDEVEVGYGFYPAYWGQGFATEIAASCVTYAWNPLGLPSIVALTVRDNVRSQHVMMKVGLAFEREVEHAGQLHMLYRMRRPTAGGDGHA